MRQSEMTTFLLRLPQALKRQLEEKAQADKRSVNSTVVDIISQALAVHPTGTSLEQRNFIGQKVTANQIDAVNGLVHLQGIYYRYLIEGNQEYTPTEDYIVIEAVGNILTLRPLMKLGGD